MKNKKIDYLDNNKRINIHPFGIINVISDFCMVCINISAAWTEELARFTLIVITFWVQLLL
jgi:hypothetical protein